MSRILLISPWRYQDEGQTNCDLSRDWRNGPYSLLLLGTILSQKGHGVSLVDLQRDLVVNKGDLQKSLNDCANTIRKFKPDIIGISFFSVHVLEVRKIITMVRETCTRAGLKPLLVAGGIHCSMEPGHVIDHIGFDIAVVGEGEVGLCRLADGEDPTSIPGVYTRPQSKYERGEQVSNLDELPFPDWHLCDTGFYAHPSYARLKIRKTTTLDVLMGRGCPYRCNFCAYGTLSSVRYHSAGYLVEQIERLHTDFGISSCYFHDSSIGTNRKLLIEMCDLMLSRETNKKFSWLANMRADQIDEKLLQTMQRAGCEYLFYGFESGSQRILDLMNKKTSVAQNYTAARLHNKLHFFYNASMIFNYPGETESDIQKTLAFLCDVKPPSIGVNWYVPLPGSKDYERLKRQGKIKEDDPSQWRRLGEVNDTRIYADIPERRCRTIFKEVTHLAGHVIPDMVRGEWESSAMHTPQETSETKEAFRPLSDTLNASSTDHHNADHGFSTALRNKWREIPATRQTRQFSTDLLDWSDEQLLAYWEKCRQETCIPEIRGWYQQLYRDQLKDSDIVEVGPGIGLDGIFFAQHGARVTFADIVEDNIKLLERICRLKHIEAEYYFIDDFFKYRFQRQYDAFLCIGSLINAPFDFAHRQIKEMMRYLKVNGKVLFLGYPKERFIKLGAKNGAEFGKLTDGERTPWCEWYDDGKIKKLFGNRFALNWNRNFGLKPEDFNWFELTKLSEEGGGNTSAVQAVKPTGICVHDEPAVSKEIDLKVQDVERLHETLGFPEPIAYPQASLHKPLQNWQMEIDDAPIFRYLYRNNKPQRHLEFGTWQGYGVRYCLEECEATVWTINLLHGEQLPDGQQAYSLGVSRRSDLDEWAHRAKLGRQHGYRTDALGFIGWQYLSRDAGNRVCQIYCDSTKWDTRNYPEGFFDSVLVDGGHQSDVVVSDTRKALPLLRRGGIMMWHDFCPPVSDQFAATRNVMSAIFTLWDEISRQMRLVFWIRPSWILLGIKR